MRPLLVALALLAVACSPRYDPAEEERKLGDTIGAYSDKIIALATIYASSGESAPDAADAAIAGAAAEYQNMQEQTVRWYAITYRDGRLDSPQGHRLAIDCRERYRAKALALIMDLRLAAKEKKPTF